MADTTCVLQGKDEVLQLAVICTILNHLHYTERLLIVNLYFSVIDYSKRLNKMGLCGCYYILCLIHWDTDVFLFMVDSSGAFLLVAKLSKKMTTDCVLLFIILIITVSIQLKSH